MSLPRRRLLTIINSTFLILIPLLGVLGWISWNITLDAWWQPTDRETVSQILDLLNIEPGDVIYDLGCGDGRFLTRAVKNYDAEAVGIEIDPVRVVMSWIRIFSTGTFSRASVVMGNMYNKDLSKANAVVLFLSGDANEKLSPKLNRELKPGTKIVSYYHKLPGWTPVKREKNNDGYNIYLYER